MNDEAPTGLIKFDGELTEQQVAQLREDFERAVRTEQPVRKIAHALAPGELAALAQQDGAPAGITDDEAYEWYQARRPSTVERVMAELAKAAEAITDANG